MIADFYDTFNKETDDDIPQEVLEVLSENYHLISHIIRGMMVHIL